MANTNSTTLAHPEFEYRFYAISRAELHATPCRLTVTAGNEQEARRQLAGQYVLSFAGCLPVRGGEHA